MQFRKPLATPDSKRVFHCYATHGKGYGHDPSISGADIRILLVSAARDVLWADARFDGHDYHCEVARLDGHWKRLGGSCWTVLCRSERSTRSTLTLRSSATSPRADAVNRPRQTLSK